MSFWSSLIGGGVKDAGDGVKTALDGAGGFLKDIRTAITGKDPELDAKLLAAQDKINAAQAEINKIEAASSTFFVAGARPAILWVCAISLALYYPIRVIMGMAMWVRLAWSADVLPTMPDMGIQDIIGLIMALLGMSGLRTYEKKEGVSR